jgi:hypothetical protein
MPNVLRWYWWRMNGWGYAAGAISGMTLSLVQALVPYFSTLPLYVTFPVIVILVFAITVIVTLMTEPTDRKTLCKFYTDVRPAGFWGSVSIEVAKSSGIGKAVKATHRRDLMNVILAVPWIASMYMCPIYLILHRFPEAIAAAVIVAGISGALYQTWYKHLEES